MYGSLKVARELERRPELEQACRNTVAAAMQEWGLNSRVRRRFHATTTQVDPTKQPAPNTLAQAFAADGPNRKWAADITYLPTAAGCDDAYLGQVLCGL